MHEIYESRLVKNIAQTTILKRAIKKWNFKQEFIEAYVSLLLATSSEHYEDI